MNIYYIFIQYVVKSNFDRLVLGVGSIEDNGVSSYLKLISQEKSIQSMVDRMGAWNTTNLYHSTNSAS